MTEREKLAEMLMQEIFSGAIIGTNDDIKHIREGLVRVADHLLVNGVVVREKGTWKDADDGDGIVCPVCKEDFCVLIYETERFNFCPHCGADMRGD